MTDDDWNAPLGQVNAPLGQVPVPKLFPAGKALIAAAALGGLGLLGFAAVDLPQPARPSGTASSAAADGLPKAATTPGATAAAAVLPESGGRPAAAAPATNGAAGQPQEAAAKKIPAAHPGSAVETLEGASGVKIVRGGGGGGAPQPLIIDVAKALSAGQPGAPDPRLMEQSRYGPIPRIGSGGGRPSSAYARPAETAGTMAGLPRIALVVGGAGLSGKATEAAIFDLPGAVTLGFAPYGTELERLTALARQAGHETLLQIPMEPFDFPRGNPAPRTLFAAAGKGANLDRLAWLMSRFSGYAGVANFLGGKFAADEGALTPVLREIAARGLFYLDDGTSPQSLALTLAPGHGLAAGRADVVLDSAAGQEAIEEALARLEAIARSKGEAIGFASALPASLAAIGRYARTLEARGFALVPASAIVTSAHASLADSEAAR